jgi:pyroglutamyl-peptidase
VVLLTGFKPFGGSTVNPSEEVVRRLNGTQISGKTVAGYTLPVSLRDVGATIDGILETTTPEAVISLGQAGSASTVLLERFAVNLADFSTPDNDGALVSDAALEDGGPTAIASRLPLRAIEAALLDAGIPVRISNSAGTYLCNAAMYLFLTRTGPETPCGFIHLPCLPEQVAAALEAARHGAGLWPASTASMSLDLMLTAIRRALEVTIRHAADARVARSSA